jgi:hypothetical protein
MVSLMLAFCLLDFSIEPASAYDASRVPCLTDREDINTTTNIYVNNLPSQSVMHKVFDSV